MTDQTSSPAKAMWTRCNACQDRIYNNAHDIKIHRLHCPYDLQLTIQKLTQRLDKLDDAESPDSLFTRVDALEQMVGDLDEQISTEPVLDPDAIDPWPGDATDTDLTDGLDPLDDDLAPNTSTVTPIGSAVYTPTAPVA